MTGAVALLSESIVELLECARECIFEHEGASTRCLFRHRAAFIDRHLAQIVTLLLKKPSERISVSGLHCCLQIIANVLALANNSCAEINDIASAKRQVFTALESLVLIFQRAMKHSSERQLIRLFQSSRGFTRLATYMTASVSTPRFPTMVTALILLESFTQILPTNIVQEEEEFKVVAGTIMVHLLNCDQTVAEHQEKICRICSLMFSSCLQLSTQNSSVLERLFGFTKELAQKLIISQQRELKGLGWDLIRDVSVRIEKLQKPPVAYIVSGAGPRCEHMNGKYVLDTTTLLNSGYMKFEGGVSYHQKIKVRSEKWTEDNNSVETEDSMSSDDSIDWSAGALKTATTRPRLSSIAISEDYPSPTGSFCSCRNCRSRARHGPQWWRTIRMKNNSSRPNDMRSGVTIEEMVAEEDEICLTLSRDVRDGKKGWFLQNPESYWYKECYYHPSSTKLPPHSGWVREHGVATSPTLEPIHLKHQEEDDLINNLADWALENSVIERAFADARQSEIFVERSMDLLRVIAPVDGRVLASMASYLNATASTDGFPQFCAVEFFLNVTLELINTDKIRGLNIAESAVSIVNSVMKHLSSSVVNVTSPNKEIDSSLSLWLNMFKLRPKSLLGMSGACTALFNLNNQTAILDFHQIWRNFALKLITSHDLTLKKVGWKHIDKILVQSKKLSPPSTSYVVSGAGSKLVNGKYDFVSSVGRTYTDCLYQRRIPSANSNTENVRTMTLFRCKAIRHTWWCLSEVDEEHPGTDQDIDYYRRKSKSDSPPNEGWQTCKIGADPPPAIVAVIPTVPEERIEYKLADWFVKNKVIELAHEQLGTKNNAEAIMALVWRTHRFSYLNVTTKFPWASLLQMLLKSMSQPLGQCAEQTEIIWFAKMSMKHVLHSLDGKSSGDVDHDTIPLIRSRVFQIYERLGSSLIYEMFTFWRDLALKLVKSQSLQSRLLGWDEIKELIKYSKTVPQPNALIAPRSGEVFNTLEHQLAQWSIEHGLIELAFGSSVNAEIVPKSADLIKFLARNHQLTEDMRTAPDQFCLNRSHLFLAGRTCSRANVSVLRKLHQLLLSVRSSLSENLKEVVDPIIKAALNRRIELDDSVLTGLRICRFYPIISERVGIYKPNEVAGLLDLGKNIGKNSNLLAFGFEDNFGNQDSLPREFLEGLCTNKSIQNLTIQECDVSDSSALSILRSFEKRKTFTLRLSFIDCDLQGGRVSLLTSNLCQLLRSLIEISFCGNRIDCDLLTELVTAIRGNQELEILDLTDNLIGRTGCITLASLLQDQHCNLVQLHLADNEIDDDCIEIISEALLQNTTLTDLDLYDENHLITPSAWEYVSQALCDSSSPSAIYHSNHSLNNIEFEDAPWSEVGDLDLYLKMNESENKKHVAMRKILHHYDSFDMESLFGLDLKILPVVLHWFEKASKASAEHTDVNINAAMLSAIYQFSQAMPLLFLPASHNKKARKRNLNELSA